MLVSLSSQAYIFLCTVLGGVIIGLVYDLFRVSRKVFKTNNYVVYFEDILFWFLGSIIIFGILFISNAGEIRGYALLGIVLGIIIYACMISHYVMKFILTIIDINKRIVKFTYKKLKGPVKSIIRALSIPILALYKLLKKVWRVINKIKMIAYNRLRLNIKNIKTISKKF